MSRANEEQPVECALSELEIQIGAGSLYVVTLTITRTLERLNPK